MIRERLLWIPLLAFALGSSDCLDGVPVPVGNQSCAQLAWNCGVDAYSVSCGTCDPAQTCANGVCSGPGATVHPIASGATAFALAGATGGAVFSVPVTSHVTFSASSTGLFQVGIFTLSQWDLFASGQPSGFFVLEGPTPSTSGAVSLDAGIYMLGFRCANTVDPCTINYWLSATY